MTIKLFLPVLALLITFTASQAFAQDAQTAPSAGSMNHSSTWENHQGNDYQKHNVNYDNQHNSNGGNNHNQSNHKGSDHKGSNHNGSDHKGSNHKGFWNHSS